MNRPRIIYAVVFLCLLTSQMARAERYVLEVDRSTARELCDPTSQTFKSLKGKDSSAQLIPVFPPPADPERLSVYYSRGLDRWFTLEAQANSPVVPEMSSKRGVGRFVLEELDMTADALPDDYSNHDLWHLDALHMPEAWDIYHGPRKVILAVIDAGFDLDHPDLAPNYYINPFEDLNENGRYDASDIDGIDNDENGYVDDILGYDFVTVTESYFQDGFQLYFAIDGEDYGPADGEVFPDIAGHGTHVAGCAGAVTDNGIGVASPAWNVDIMPLRAAFACELESGDRITTGWATDFAQAIYYAANNGAQIISLSYSRLTETQTVHSAIQYATDLGVLFFSSAGNRGIPSPAYPAAYPEAISVSALNPDLVKPGWASMGSWVDLCAPGTNIWSTMSSDLVNPVDYAPLTGTSMSTPLVASVAALAFAANPLLLAHDVRQLLFDTAIGVDSLNPDFRGELGAGLVNAEALIAQASEMILNPEDLQVTLDDRTGEVDLTWQFYGNELGESAFSHFELLCDGTVCGEAVETSATAQLSAFGYHTYRVEAVYQTGERRSSESVAVFYVGPYGAVPEMQELEVVDSQFGTVEARWCRGEVSGVHRLHELQYDNSADINLISMPYRGAGMRVTPDAPCRLLQVRFYAHVEQAGIVFVDLYPFDGTTPSTTPISTISTWVDSGAGWQVVDFYGESIAFSGDMVLNVRPSSGALLELGECNVASNRAWLPTDQSTWEMEDDTFAIRALIAIRDEDRQEIHQGGGVGGNSKTDDEDAWCTYNFYEAGEVVGSTLDTLFSTRLSHTGQTSIRLNAVYANGATTWSDSRSLMWDRGTEYFTPAEPTSTSQAAYITNLRIDDVVPSDPVEVGVFDDGLCVGAIRITPDMHAPYRIALWHEDVQQQLPGYRDNAPIEYRIWREGLEEERALLVIQENGSDIFGGEAPRVSLHSYIPQPPSSFAILSPEEDLVLQPDDDYMLSFSWSYAEDPDPYQSARYEFYAHLTSPEVDTLLSFVLASRSYTQVNLPLSAEISSWSDTLTAEVWVEAVSPPDRIRSDNTLRIHFLSEFSGPVPDQFELGAAYPNPFNGYVNLPIALPENGTVRYELFDLLGRRITSHQVRFAAGYHILQLGSEIHNAMPGSGVYFLRVKHGDRQLVRKLVHMK